MSFGDAGKVPVLVSFHIFPFPQISLSSGMNVQDFSLEWPGLWSYLKHSILALSHLFWEFYTYLVKCPS